MQGSELAASQPIINGIRLAVKQAGGAPVATRSRSRDAVVFDDALNGAHDPQTGRQQHDQIVGDPDIIAVIGPLNSSVALAADPDLERGGPVAVLPGQHEPGPHQGRSGGAELRGPSRTTTSASPRQTTSRARPARSTSSTCWARRSVYIIDDTETFGKGVADAFEARVHEAGGTVVKRDGAAEDHRRTTSRS